MQEVGTEMREQESVETMGAAEAMDGGILVAGMSLKTIGVAAGEDFQIVGVMDIRGLIKWGTMAGV